MAAFRCLMTIGNKAVKKLIIVLLPLIVLLLGCGKSPDADIPVETISETQSIKGSTKTTEESQNTVPPATEEVTNEGTVTEPKDAAEPTGTELLGQTETTGSNESENPSHGIELPDDNW